MGRMLRRLQDAMNAHDPEALQALFAPDYRSIQRAHPDRDFVGRAQVGDNWAAVFAGVPDFTATLHASSVDEGTEWGEWTWTGHHRDGSVFAMAGVIIVVVRDGLISEGRVFMEPVEAGEDIRGAVRDLYRPD